MLRSIAAVLLAVSSEGLLAAEITVVSGKSPCPYWVSLTGTINSGDGNRLQTLLERSTCEMNSVRLNSDGGDLREAMRIGRVLRRHNVIAGVVVGTRCASSCVVAFAGAVKRSLGGIGVHRPYLADGRTLSSDQIEKEWRAVTGELRSYFEEMNVSLVLVELLMNTPPEKVRWLSEKEQYEYGLVEDPVADEIDVARAAAYYRLTSAEYRKRYNEALDRCDTVLREVARTDPRVVDPDPSRLNICLDSVILRLDSIEVSRRHGAAESVCPQSLHNECWQSIVVDGKRKR